MIARRIVLALPLAALARPALAQSLAGKTIRFIVPFPPGGVNDALARITADKLQQRWNATIIVENKTGAGGNIGADAVAQAAPDGTTLFVTAPGPLAINQSLFRQLSYKPEAFVPVTLLGHVPNLAIVKNDLPVKTLAEFVAYVRERPGKVIYGTQGNGATPHLTAGMFMNLTGTSMVHVPYRGETLVLQDMLGGHVDVFFGNVSSSLGLWRECRIRVLAVLDKTRASQMPDVPTAAEAGMPDLISTGWFAVAAPPKTPLPLRDEIATAFRAVVAMPDVQARFRALSVEPVGSSPEETVAFLAEETRRWGAVIREAKISVD